MKASLLILALLLPGCTTIAAVKNIAPKIADKAMEASYKIMCNQPYSSERRFIVKYEISPVSFQVFCRRKHKR